MEPDEQAIGFFVGTEQAGVEHGTISRRDLDDLRFGKRFGLPAADGTDVDNGALPRMGVVDADLGRRARPRADRGEPRPLPRELTVHRPADLAHTTGGDVDDAQPAEPTLVA